MADLTHLQSCTTSGSPTTPPILASQRRISLRNKSGPERPQTPAELPPTTPPILAPQKRISPRNKNGPERPQTSAELPATTPAHRPKLPQTNHFSTGSSSSTSTTGSSVQSDKGFDDSLSTSAPETSPPSSPDEASNPIDCTGETPSKPPKTSLRSKATKPLSCSKLRSLISEFDNTQFSTKTGVGPQKPAAISQTASSRKPSNPTNKQDRRAASAQSDANHPRNRHDVVNSCSLSDEEDNHQQEEDEDERIVEKDDDDNVDSKTDALLLRLDALTLEDKEGQPTKAKKSDSEHRRRANDIQRVSTTGEAAPRTQNIKQTTKRKGEKSKARGSYNDGRDDEVSPDRRSTVFSDENDRVSASNNLLLKSTPRPRSAVVLGGKPDKATKTVVDTSDKLNVGDVQPVLTVKGPQATDSHTGLDLESNEDVEPLEQRDDLRREGEATGSGEQPIAGETDGPAFSPFNEDHWVDSRIAEELFELIKARRPLQSQKEGEKAKKAKGKDRGINKTEKPKESTTKFNMCRLYVYTSKDCVGYYKVGKTKFTTRKRQTEWEKKCGMEIFYLDRGNSRFSEHFDLAEKLIEKELCNYRRKFACRVCKSKSGGFEVHKEWYEIEKGRLLKTVANWEDWIINEKPYGEDGQLRPRWQWLHNQCNRSKVCVDWQKWTQPFTWTEWFLFMRSHAGKMIKDYREQKRSLLVGFMDTACVLGITIFSSSFVSRLGVWVSLVSFVALALGTILTPCVNPDGTSWRLKTVGYIEDSQVAQSRTPRIPGDFPTDEH